MDRSTYNPTSTAAEQTTRTDKAKGGRSLIHAFVGFIYLSYIKISVSSTLILSNTAVIKQDGSYLSSPRLVYFAGQYTMSDPSYLFPYGLIAGTMFVLVGICLPLLLLGPLDLINLLLDQQNRVCDYLRRKWPSVRINIFLEAFRNCYKPERRYFAGIYFLYRLIMLIIFAFTSSPLYQALWQLMITIVMMLLIAVFQPHKEAFHNFIDVLILLNMTGIAIISVYLYTSPSQLFDASYPVEAYNGGLFLVWLPMSYLLLFLCWLVLRRTAFYQKVVYKLNPLLRKISPVLSLESEPERQPLLSPVARGRSQAENEQDLFERAEAPNQYKPAKRRVHTTVVDVQGTSGTADVHSGTGRTVNNSSGFESNNTGSSSQSNDCY